MGLRSAVEDFTSTTLACLTGPLRRLEYIAQLRNENGDYEHWGMSRVHGLAAAQSGITQAHSDVLRMVLRTPLSQLFEECRRGDDGIPPPGDSSLRQLLPEDLSGGSELHLKSILIALQSLADAAERPHREAA
jgi:hypothetical protein